MAGHLSGYSEVGIAPGLGPGDRAFEPHYSDQPQWWGLCITPFLCYIKTYTANLSLLIEKDIMISKSLLPDIEIAL